MKSILLVEDYCDIRNWLNRLATKAFANATIIEAATVSQALSHLEQHHFDLALLDYHLPDGSALDIIEHIKQTTPSTYCVIATIFDDDKHLFDCLRAGAQGYLLKEQDEDELVDNLRSILSGDPPISPPIARRIIRFFNEDCPPPPQEANQHKITKRECEILTMVAKGMNRKQIGEALNLSANTVATHIKSIYRKLNISSKSEATLKAISLGLIEPD